MGNIVCYTVITTTTDNDPFPGGGGGVGCYNQGATLTVHVNGYPIPPHISYSALTTYQSCGTKYYLSRIEKRPEVPAWWFAGGNAVHTATEEIDRLYPTVADLRAHAEEISDPNFFLDAFAYHVAETLDDVGQDVPVGWRAGGRATKAFPDKENDDWWIANGPAMVRNWINWRLGCGWDLAVFDGVPAVELGFDFSLGAGDDEFVVRMYLDRLFVSPDGQLILVDLKSGSSTPKDNLQLGMYAYGVEKCLGIRPSYGTFWKARDGATTQLVDLEPLSSDKVESIVIGFDKLRKQGIFLPNLSECGWCGFKDTCEWGKV